MYNPSENVNKFMTRHNQLSYIPNRQHIKIWQNNYIFSNVHYIISYKVQLNIKNSRPVPYNQRGW